MSKLQLMYVSVDHEKAKRHAESGNEHTRQHKSMDIFFNRSHFQDNSSSSQNAITS